MALTAVERQQRYRNKLRNGELSRIDIKLPVKTANKLRYLAEYWRCSKTEALSRCLDNAWEQIEQPTAQASWSDSIDHIDTLSDLPLLPDDLAKSDARHPPCKSTKSVHELVYQI